MSNRLGKRTEYKLYELKPNFNSKCPFLNLNRHEQTKITRCRIGHTRLTHTYLLNNEQSPFYVSCNEPFYSKTFSHYMYGISSYSHKIF